MFKITKKSKKSSARLGRLQTKHGVIETPFFMPIASKGTIKALTSDEIKKIGAQILLSNTYHIYLQPSIKVIKKFKGLHKFMNWNGPILTDSGGYQVFSLGEKFKRPLGRFSNDNLPKGSMNNNETLAKASKKGVEFKSFLDGSNHLFTPEKVQQIQDVIGSDIKMALDVCSPYPCSKKQAEKDLELTHVWAQKSLVKHTRLTGGQGKHNLLFGIVQGSVYKDLRIKSAKFLSDLDFDGYALGGLAVGEPIKKMYQVLAYTLPELPENKPRYLMGMGKPEQIIEAVKHGVDMFDCVIPTREARHGRLYKTQNSINRTQGFYKIININNAKYKNSTQSIDKNCTCELCQNYSAGYLHHLFKSGEPLALRLASLHNVKFYLTWMKKIRLSLARGKL